VLLLDDLDAVLARCQEAYQAPVVELVTRLLRDGPTDGSWCVLTTQRVGGALHGLATLCGSQLVLRMPNRAEHALAGGDPQHYVDGLPPGAGLWRGNRVQVASAPATIPVPRIPRSRSIDLTTARLAVVSTRPERFAEALRESAPHRRILPLAPVGYGERQDSLAISVGDMPPIVIADPDLWQSQWSLFAGLQRGGEILFDGCSLAEVRALTRSRELPPPFAAGARPLWLRTTEGELARATLK
jgi:S-DNA-T family DNA segregation ATPase FtsK/SpoIIIE